MPQTAMLWLIFFSFLNNESLCFVEFIISYVEHKMMNHALLVRLASIYVPFICNLNVTQCSNIASVFTMLASVTRLT